MAWSSLSDQNRAKSGSSAGGIELPQLTRAINESTGSAEAMRCERSTVQR